MLQEKAVQPHTLALLIKLSNLSILSSFGLGGGTNLALRYGHRFSVDLDFFTNQPFDTKQLFHVITKTFPTAELLFEQNQTMLFTIDEIKVDFILYPFPWLTSFDTINEIKFIGITDIIPMKLQAIGNRKAKKDYWDIFHLLKEYSLSEMIVIFKKKFPQIDEGYIIHALTDFEDAENQFDPDCNNSSTWQDVKKGLENTVRKFTEALL